MGVRSSESVLKLRGMLSYLQAGRLSASKVRETRQEVESCYPPSSAGGVRYASRLGLMCSLHEGDVSEDSLRVCEVLDHFLGLIEAGNARNLCVSVEPEKAESRVVVWLDSEIEFLRALSA
jgi:hypothetical protein